MQPSERAGPAFLMGLERPYGEPCYWTWTTKSALPRIRADRSMGVHVDRARR